VNTLSDVTGNPENIAATLEVITIFLTLALTAAKKTFRVPSFENFIKMC
jgi:hypothetical protein